MNKRFKNLIITFIIILVIILIFVLFANPLPKKAKDKTYTEKLATIKQIDIIIHSPFETSGVFKAAIMVTEKSELENILSLIKDADMLTDTYETLQEDDQFYYTMLLKSEDNKNNLNILVKEDYININGAMAKLDSDNIEKLNEYINDNVKGYGILNCKKENTNNTIVEKYYFKEGKIYYYSKSQTYIPDDVNQIVKDINLFNNYAGVSASGNTLGKTKYSYYINIDLNTISNTNYERITKENKDKLIEKTKEDLIKEKNDMICDYSFL